MADLSKSLAEQISDLAKSLPQSSPTATVSKPSWWQFWKYRERRKAQNMEKIMNFIIDREVTENGLMDKVRQQIYHEMTCGDLSHKHGAVYTSWSQVEGTDLAATDHKPSTVSKSATTNPKEI